MRLLSFFLFASLAITTIDAGCHPHGKRSPEKTQQLKNKGLYSASGAKPAHAYPLDELPSRWDWCNVEGQSFCTASWNQHIPMYCGACWVHGALGAVNDRVKIALGGKHDLMLARQVILNCAQSKGFGAGCNGGDGQDVFEYMHRYGLPDESCQIYMAKSTETCDAAAICHNCMPVGEDIFPYKCWAVEDPAKVYVKEYGTVSGEAGMMSEIIERGPITCGFASVDDFDYNYRGGVYIDTTNATDVNHDVEIVGWGVDEDGTKYWKARNSWGTYWGENGFFRIVRGINNMLIEEECTFAIPDVKEHRAFLSGKYGGSMYGIVPRGKKTNTPMGVPQEGDPIYPATYPPVTPAPGSPEDPASYPDADSVDDQDVSKHGKALGPTTTTPVAVDTMILSQKPIDFQHDHTTMAKQGQAKERAFLQTGVKASGYDIPQVEQGFDLGNKWQDEAKAQGWGGDASGQSKAAYGGAGWQNGGWKQYYGGAGAANKKGGQANGVGNWQQYIPQAMSTIDTTSLSSNPSSTSTTTEPDITAFQHVDDTWIHQKHIKLDHKHTKNALKGYERIATKYADVYVHKERHVKHRDDVDEEIVVINKDPVVPVVVAGGGGGAGSAGDWQKYIPGGAAAGGAGGAGAGTNWQQYIPAGTQTSDLGAPGAASSKDSKHATHTEIDTTVYAQSSSSSDFAAYIRRGSDWIEQDTPRLADIQRAWAVNALHDYDRLSTKYVDVYVLAFDDKKKHHKKDDVEEQIIVVTKEQPADQSGVGAMAGGGGGAGAAGDWQKYIPKGVAAGGASGAGAGAGTNWQQYIPAGVMGQPTAAELKEKEPKDDSISVKQYEHELEKEEEKHDKKHHGSKYAHHTLAEDPAIRDTILDILAKHGIHPNQQKDTTVTRGEDPNLAIKRTIADALTKGDENATKVKDSIKQALQQVQDEWFDEADRQSAILKQENQQQQQTHAVRDGVHDVSNTIGKLISDETDSAKELAADVHNRATSELKHKPSHLSLDLAQPKNTAAITSESIPSQSSSSIMSVFVFFAIAIAGITGYVYHSRAKQDYLPIQ